MKKALEGRSYIVYSKFINFWGDSENTMELEKVRQLKEPGYIDRHNTKFIDKWTIYSWIALISVYKNLHRGWFDLTYPFLFQQISILVCRRAVTLLVPSPGGNEDKMIYLQETNKVGGRFSYIRPRIQNKTIFSKIFLTYFDASYLLLVRLSIIKTLQSKDVNISTTMVKLSKLGQPYFYYGFKS